MQELLMYDPFIWHPVTRFIQFIADFNNPRRYHFPWLRSLPFFVAVNQNVMKQILLAAVIIFVATVLASCEKDRDVTPAPAHPQMTYRDHSHRVVNITTPGGIDISGDGPSDVWFEIFYDRDPATNTDTHRFMVSSGETSKLMILNGTAAPLLEPGNAISTQVTNGYELKSPGRVEIARRTLVHSNGAISWSGVWKDAQRK